MRRLIVVLAVVLAFGAACGPKAPNYNYAQEPDPRTSEYVIGVGDQLLITVWQQEGLTTETTVRPDGTITMPLIGDFKASGETPTALKQVIKTKLGDFVKLEKSEITVSVQQANSYRFTVSGEVVRPGVYQETYYVTVAEAIALAGGFTRFARRNDMVLMRRDGKSGEVRKIPLAYDFLASGRRPDMNIVVLAGDSIYVP